jgi:N-acetylglucosamine kinase
MKTYVIGIDGGGTKTIAVLTDTQGNVVARQAAPASNFQVLSHEQFRNVIVTLIDALLEKSGIQRNQVAAAFLGIAGVGRDEDKSVAKSIIEQSQTVGNIAVDHDAVAALAGAFAGKPGIILIAGTGSICFGRTSDGKLIRSGGWGYLLGDEGSGYYIAQQGIIAALKDLDGRGEKTALRVLFEKHFQIESIDKVVSIIYQKEFTRADMAALAPLVFAAAEQEDNVAVEIVIRAGIELGKMVNAVVAGMNLRSEPIRLALEGSIFKHKKHLVSALENEIRKFNHRLEIVSPLFEPALGGAILALEMLGVGIDQQILSNLQSSHQILSSKS